MNAEIASEIEKLAAEVLAACRKRGVMLTTAESCTGGLIAGALTAIAGSSDVMERGFVTYSNEAKIGMLRVPAEIIAGRGAVSEEVARAMAEGAVRNSNAQIGIACTGIAGPGNSSGGGSAAKPVGLVHIAVAMVQEDTLHAEMHYGDIGRAEVREATVRDALKMALRMLGA
ncbi:CinA family protein [Ferrovibrio sp.]|uniref:CinA family protein n=1 Tax=Ferrovibrio sp. TaxID=1917215 RepID=UPI0035B4C365